MKTFQIICLLFILSCLGACCEKQNACDTPQGTYLVQRGFEPPLIYGTLHISSDCSYEFKTPIWDYLFADIHQSAYCESPSSLFFMCNKTGNVVFDSISGSIVFFKKNDKQVVDRNSEYTMGQSFHLYNGSLINLQTRSFGGVKIKKTGFKE